MKEFTLKVQVSVDLAPAAASLVASFLKMKGAEHEAPALPVGAAEPAKTEPKPAMTEPKEPAMTEPKEPAKTEPKAEPKPAEPEPKEPAETEKPEPKPEYNDVYIRNAIDRTRMRIEGENYKQETTSERYKKYHKALTGEFKRIAMTLAASLGQEALDKVTERDPKGEEIVKPTRLPEIGLAEAFSRSCDELYVDENGELAVKAPY